MSEFREAVEVLGHHYGLTFEFDEVKVSSCAEHGYEGWLRTAEVKACYNNTFNCIADLRILHGDPKDARYVVGYAAGLIPVDHAWVKVGGAYFDPTWEKHTEIGEHYLPVFEIPTSELMGWIEKNDMRPPSLHDMARMTSGKRFGFGFSI